ncbi:hypothetical protein [Oligoflexus tunisiensis]|uniref:hypothetical protein n=1 Tax=Oligoflexus tunisiensis TaxID=708132 RepID=UPI00114C9B45|nr:hypothetical protein [Oligoflexus tunisiensis]
MKRQKVLLLLALTAALAVGFFLLNRSVPETAPVENHDTMTTTEPAAGPDIVQDPPAEPAQKAKTTAAVEPDPVASTQVEEPVAEKIQENFQVAREAFQKKDVIAKSKTEEVHHMPRPTLEAARRLGEIAELEAQHPEQAESFREFYLECARDTDTITVIRAQCLDKYVKVSKMDSAGQKQFVRDFPEEVVRLYEALQ